MENSRESTSAVALVRCERYDAADVHQAVERGLELLGGLDRFARRGERILLKPNLLVGRSPDRAVTTHPSVLRAVGMILKDHGCQLTYGDSPGYPGSAPSMARRAGFEDVADALGIEAADFSIGVEVPFPDGEMIKRFTIAQPVMGTDGMVSLPKMKTHGLTRITGALKNQFGCIPGVLKAEFHARLPNADLFSRMLVDLNRLLRPRLYVLDAIVAMEGNGPQSGTPRTVGLLALSEDPVALDATICRLMTLDPALVLPVVYGDRAGLGRMSGFPLVGDPLDSFVAEDFQVNRSPRSTTGKPGRLSRLARRLVVPKPAIRPERCTRCGTCVAICPVDPKAVQFRDPESGRVPQHNYARCVRCYCCQELCPARAIDIQTPILGRLIHRG